MRPVTLPSLVAARVSFCHWSRPWWADTSDSERVSVYLHGLADPAGRPHQVIHSSGVVCSLPPKPPPTSGAITRILDSGTPVVAASRNRMMCGIWVADHMVICSPVGSTTIERGSMNAGISRCWRYSRSMTMPSARASAMHLVDRAAGALASAESSCQNADLLVPRSGCASTLSVGGLLEVEHGGQLLVLDVHELGGVARLGGACGRRRRRRSRRRRRPGRSAIGRWVGRDLVGGDRPGVGDHALGLGRGPRR